VVQGRARPRRLAADRGELQDPAAALPSQVRQPGPYQPDRAGQVGRDLVHYLLVGQLLGRAHQAVPGIAGHDVNPAQGGPCLVDHRSDLGRVRDVELGRVEGVRPAGRQIVDAAESADGADDAVAAGQELLAEVPAETAVGAGDEPGF
jgi:hypothetical protein